MQINISQIALLLMAMKVPYIWGGNNPIQGMDCSGFVSEVLRSIGYIEDDYSALGLYNLFIKDKRCVSRGQTGERKDGDLLFFGKNRTAITHVAIAITESGNLMIEAGGGGSKTINKDIAGKTGAYVRIRPISHRKDLVAVLGLNEITDI